MIKLIGNTVNIWINIQDINIILILKQLILSYFLLINSFSYKTNFLMLVIQYKEESKLYNFF